MNKTAWGVLAAAIVGGVGYVILRQRASAAVGATEVPFLASRPLFGPIEPPTFATWTPSQLDRRINEGLADILAPLNRKPTLSNDGKCITTYDILGLPRRVCLASGQTVGGVPAANYGGGSGVPS